jgi:ATP-dependent Clp protease ATP-binding subunit ClpA
MLAENGKKLSISANAKEKLIDMGFNPVFGARALRRVVSKTLIDALSIAMLEDEEKTTYKVKLNKTKDNIVVN